MSIRLLLSCAIGLLVLAPLQAAHAQYRRGRSGIVQSPYGPLYDTRSPEWRMAGGNIFLYQQIMEEKMQLRQQQLLMKQQQMMMRQSQRGNRKGNQSSNGWNGPPQNGNSAPTASSKTR